MFDFDNPLVVGASVPPADELSELIVATHKAVRRQHIMVAEEGGRRVRGLFSAAQVARQLGLELQTMEIAQTFADVEAALAR